MDPIKGCREAPPCFVTLTPLHLCHRKEPLTTNSIHSTCVFACFEAHNTIANFHIALDRYKEEVVNLAASQWK